MAGATSDPTTLHNHTTTPSSNSGNDDNNNKLYKGVRKRKWGKWVSEIRLPNSRERIWLGSYDSPHKAARAFDAALYCLRGRHANFNFPDTPKNLEINNIVAIVSAGHKSLTPQQIQEIAAKFANENQPQRGHDIDAANSFGGSTSTSTSTTNITASSSSTNIYEYDQVENGDMMSKMDWTFLNELDHHDGSDYYGLYSDLDKMHSGELLYSTPVLPTSFDDNEDQIEVDDDPFSHQSFLWNWNF